MNYEKLYKEAFERMKSWARGEHPECFSEAKKAAEFIFPELKKSEDERLEETNMVEYRYTKVFDVNGHLVIAPNIEDAIKVFKEYDANAEITSIKAVSSYTPNIGDNFNALTLKNKVGYNPYKVTVESISRMFEQPYEDKDDLIANIKIKCKDAIEYERKYNDENS